MGSCSLRALTVFVCLATAAVPAFGRKYWVAQRHPGASDENPGSAGRPWETLARATAALGPGDTLTIAGRCRARAEQSASTCARA